MIQDLESLEAAIGYRFTDKKLLERALTHSSHVYEHPLEGLRDNEQLEFLGDSVLGFLISAALFRAFPDYSEGRLSTIKAHLVSASYLLEVARKLNLGSYLQLSPGEETSGGRSKKALLSNALEAVIAAIYLDGGLEPAREFVSAALLAGDGLESGAVESQLPGGIIDFKSALQELAHSRGLPPPHYTTVRESGPGHSKTFTIEVRVGREWSSQAEGFTKKSAAQKAARDVYEQIARTPAGV
jgi:ribonuclease-3